MTEALNRAARRAAMKERKRPGLRRERPVTPDTIVLATARATRATPDEVQSVLGPLSDAFKALREGVGTELQWAILAGSLNVAMTIENQGVVRGLAGHLTAAERALQGVANRAMASGAWRATALYWQEIEAIDEFVSLHRFQLEQLSNGEIRRAINRSAAIVEAQGGKVLDVSELRHQAALELNGAPA
jgi:hypothetical protein